MWTLEKREERERQELALVGAMLLDDRIAALLADDLRPVEFFDGRIRIIFRAAVALLEEGSSTRPESVVEALHRRGKLSQAGGEKFILGLAKGGPTLDKALEALLRILGSMPKPIVFHVGDSPIGR
jgi:replicative DNA helicase